MNINEEKVDERILIKVLNNITDEEYNKWDKAGGSFDDLVQLINNKSERVWSKFYLMICEKYDEALEADKKKHYNPDYEDWLKHPENEIYKHLD